MTLKVTGDQIDVKHALQKGSGGPQFGSSSPDSHPGVIQPAGAGYAGGIGVQVLDGNSNPVVFETQTVVTPPNATTSIPYFAQYFQTAPTVSGGNVKATVTFDIFYQ
ncbi:MAG: fimbrial protein [Pseudomonadota bacterium]|nr:fimbrial protein [Pseudomonadota bacterium]